jgi:hypothetical protein
MSFSFQKNAILQIKESNPDGRFWLKADGVDIKPALQESVNGKWEWVMRI